LSGVACGGNGGARLCTVRMQLRGSASRKNHACPPVTSLLLSQWCDTRSPLEPRGAASDAVALPSGVMRG
jgi:hypothetical protein